MMPQQTIYVVDDDISIRRSLRVLLGANGFNVTTFSDPVEFLDQVDDRGPSCALVDMKMPHLSGLDVQKRMMEASLSLPIIYEHALYR